MYRVIHNSYYTVNFLPLPAGTHTEHVTHKPSRLHSTYLASSAYSNTCSCVEAVAEGSSVPTTIMGGCTLQVDLLSNMHLMNSRVDVISTQVHVHAHVQSYTCMLVEPT